VIRPGDIVGHYEVLEELGRGAVGVVYSARHRTLGRKDAIKVLRRERVQDAEQASRFFTEAVALSRSGHDHIVSVLDYGVAEGGDSYYVMELLDGETLGARVRREGALPIAEVVHIGRQLTVALAVAHGAGVIHRDLKPENVFLCRRGPDRSYVKVLDFGMAKLLQAPVTPHALTRSGTVLGTPLYMSPEQCQGKRDRIDHRSDIYALGIILFELLAGTPPFLAANMTDLMVLHLTGALPPLRERRPEVPAELEALIGRLCAKEQARRPASMDEVGAALGMCLPGPSVA
jgi:serine/threonine-protein kinase